MSASNGGKVGAQGRALFKNVTIFNSGLKYFHEVMNSETVKNELRIQLANEITMGEECQILPAQPSA